MLSQSLKYLIFVFLLTINTNTVFAWDTTIPKTTNSQVIEDILRENKDNILFPDMVNSLKPLSKPIGWEYNMVKFPYGELGSQVYRLKEVVGNEYYFDLLNISSEKSRIFKYMIKNGLMYHAINNTNKNNPFEYQTSSEEECKFILGLCEFKSYAGRPQKQYTEFKNGVWIYKQTSFTSNEGDLVKVIYDASGMQLYYYYQSLKTGGNYEERRIERFPSSGNK